jgi:hypothetical protein
MNYAIPLEIVLVNVYVTFNAILILRKNWMKITAACCFGIEITVAASLMLALAACSHSDGLDGFTNNPSVRCHLQGACQ